MSSAPEMFQRHRATLDAAVAALSRRDYWTPYPETPSGKIYGETANADGRAAFEARRGKPFALDRNGDQAATVGTVGAEVSPYGGALGVQYPKPDLDKLLAAAKAAMPRWVAAGPEARVGVCLEILQRLNKRSFEIAYAIMHTTGQGFAMSFQAGGPHAQDRGLEAVAYAYAEMSRTPAEARWTKPQGKAPALVMEKSFHIVPRGIGLVIGCATFPTWNGYPAIFADLATGNAVVVKPHPNAVLPLAITVEIARAVLAEAGFDANLIALAADTPEQPIAKDLAVRPEIAIVDFTGGAAFGDWVEANARQAEVFTEKSGVNAVILHSTDDFQGLCRNLAFSLSLYSGQMCTTPQNLLLPKDGIDTNEGRKSLAEVEQGIAKAIQGLLGDAERAAEILGAIQNPATLKRLDEAATLGKVVLASTAPGHPRFPEATLRTPLLVEVDAADEAAYAREMFGPIAFVVAARDIDDAIRRARRSAAAKGAITWSAYATDSAVIERIEAAAIEAGVALSCNLTGGVFVNQAAAFSDFHVTGRNPAGNAALTDAAFVARRFHVVQVRRPAAPPPAAAA